MIRQSHPMEESKRDNVLNSRNISTICQLTKQKKVPPKHAFKSLDQVEDVVVKFDFDYKSSLIVE